jgi:acyl-coenzyme A thioesterase PaaI-like protein
MPRAVSPSYLVSDEEARPPEGFKRIEFSGGDVFNRHIGPLYVKGRGDDFVMGVRVAPYLCNPAGGLHGGMMMTVLDLVAGVGSSMQAGLAKFLPTVSMTFDFVAPGKLGDWLEGRNKIVRVTRSLVFTTVMLESADGPICRGSAILKIPSGEGAKIERAKLVAP